MFGAASALTLLASRLVGNTNCKDNMILSSLASWLESSAASNKDSFGLTEPACSAMPLFLSSQIDDFNVLDLQVGDLDPN